MNTTHTPGPWTLWGGTSREGLPYFLIGPVDPRGGGVPQSGVATVDFVPAHADAMGRNARLIATAPELLEALTRLVDYVFLNKDYDAVSYAEYVIAKAEGRAT